HMRFFDIGLAEVIAFGLSVTVGIMAALHGLGEWSLVLMTFGRHLANSLLFIIGTRWLPQLPSRGSGIRSMVGFGMNITGFSLFNYFARNTDNFIIGKYFGVASLGQYSRAYGLMITPLAQLVVPVKKSLFPALSRLVDKPDEYRAMYLKYNRLFAWFLCVPIAGVSLFGEEIFVLVLGIEWAFAGQLFEWLAIASFIQPLTNLTGLVFTTNDRTRAMFYWGILNSLVVIVGFGVGAYFAGAIGVAVFYAVTNALMAPVCFHFAFMKSALNNRSFYGAVGAPLSICAALIFLRFF
ncbi:oligosaccharide flippase family protein, partial [Akkermansiaceae bacterium]|nr:oligosaccharide flippase family protein [Akkermansiaceae bacterium]